MILIEYIFNHRIIQFDAQRKVVYVCARLLVTIRSQIFGKYVDRKTDQQEQ